MKKFKMVTSVLLTCLFIIGGISTSINAKALSINNLKLTVENCNVIVLFSDNGEFNYDFDNSKFKLTTSSSNSNFDIKIYKIEGATVGWNDTIKVYIPEKYYNEVNVVSNKAGIKLPSINANMLITNNSGAVSIEIPFGYNKNLNYTSIKGSGSLNINSSNFSINSNSKASSVSVPKDWPTFRNGNYNYNCGDGSAKINLNLTSSSFSIKK